MTDDAIASFKEAIRLKPDDAKNHFCLGVAYRNQELFDDAICELKEAVRLGPEDATNHNQLGCVYSDKEMWDEAIVAWKETVQLEPDSAVFNPLTELLSSIVSYFLKSAKV